MTIQKKLLIGLLVLLFVLSLAACKKKTTQPNTSNETPWTEDPSTNNTGSNLPIWDKDKVFTNISGGGSTGGDSSGGNLIDVDKDGSPECGDGGNQEPSKPETPNKLHNENFRVFLPWAAVHDGNGNWEYTWVNSSDTNKINQLWRRFIKRVAYKDEPFYMRNYRNRNSQARFKDGNDYYLFDDNLDIWYANRLHQTPLKKFVAGVIIQYKGGKYDGVYTIGGLYRTYAKTNPASGNWDDYGINMFMGISEGRPTRHSTLNGYKGDLEVIVVNVGKIVIEGGNRANPKPEYAIDIYYSDQQYDKNGLPVGRAWIEDENTYIGQNPKNHYGYKLNRALLLSEGWYYNKYFFTFVPYWDK